MFRFKDTLRQSPPQGSIAHHWDHRARCLEAHYAESSRILPPGEDLPVCPHLTSKQVSPSLQLQRSGWERISKEGLKQKDRVSKFMRKTKQVENTAEMNCYISNPGNILWKD